jgi:hypothetical protein
MRMIATHLVVVVEIEPGLHLAAIWNGGRSVALHVDRDGLTVPAGRWDIWNPIWDAPLIRTDREAFERFVAGRLAEPGVADDLLAQAAA